MTQQPRTLLIVDDAPEDRELYRRYLSRDREYDYTILEASLGQEGLELWHEHQPDAVLLDYRLPDLDGLEFLRRLQSDAPEIPLPVIVLTGEGNEAIAVQAMKAGAQDYLVKGQLTAEGLQLGINGVIEAVRLRTQLQQRIERERVIAQITQQMHQSLSLADILQTTVTEVRQFLHTDRVLVFRLHADGNGTVVAESVGSEWQSLLTSTLYDPCLAANYLRFSQSEPITHALAFAEDDGRRYRQRQVTAIADIHNSAINPCHVALLVSFQVRANLVVPILHDDQFWGLLIAHHCSAPRSWETLELGLLKELATQLSVALRQAELYEQAQAELTERRRVEIELRESEERFRQLAENIDAVFWIKEKLEDRVSYVSPAYERLWGLDPQELHDVPLAWVDHIHPDDRDWSFNAFQSKAAIGQFDEEYRLVLADGSIRWVRDRCFPLRNDAGEVYRFAGIAEDITDRKRTEKAVRRSEERFRTSVENMLDCFGIYKAVRHEDGQIVDFQTEYVNDAACLSNRLTREEQLGRGLCELLPGHRGSGLFDEYCQVVETGRPLVKDSLVYEDDYGQQRLSRAFDIRIAKLGDGFIATWRDITERKQTEEALRQSEERYRTLFESMEDGFCVIELLFDETNTPIDYRFLELNPAFERQTGLAQAIGQTARQLVPGLEDHWFEAYGRVALTGEPIRFENGSDAIHRWFDVYAFRLGQPENRKVAVLFKDISDRKIAEQEREILLVQEQAARAEAERANRIKDEFLAILSHELRSPLSPILGWTQLLQTRTFDPATTAKALATIERNAKLQTQLIDDLLDMAKILRGKFTINATPVNLAYVIESAIETIRTAAVAKNILLHSVLPTIGQVHGDATRLQQVIWNLLSNAIKFTPNNGRVDICLEQVGNQAQVTLSDTGKGIDPAFLPHIFESFRQEDVSITRKYGGLGLGLAIVRSLVEAHGGTIRASSAGEGLGTTFTMQLPLLTLVPDSEQPEVLSEQTLDLTGIRVLTVDDDFDTRDLLHIILTQYGAEVLTVQSATEVLANLERFQPDVLVSDIGMPDIDGYTLIQQIRTLPPENGGQLPAIALTAYARELDNQRAIASGYQQHITKPLEPERLVRAVMALACSSPNALSSPNDSV
jgi:PAS domain S-box-containing protein